MANPNRPRGFRPVKTKSGGPWTGSVRAVYSAATERSSDTTNNHGDIYIGDPINITSASGVIPANSNVAVSGIAVGFGHASTVHMGAVGTTYVPAPPFDPSNLTKRYLAYDESGWIYYVEPHDVLFEIQSNSDLDLKVGSLADTTIVAATAHGSRTTGYSSVELTTASDNDVQVVEIVLSPDNDPTLTNTRYLVELKIQNFEPDNAT